MKLVLKIFIVVTMAGLFGLISINAFSEILDLRENDFTMYLAKCIATWIKSIILSQAVFFAGGLFLYVLRDKKRNINTPDEHIPEQHY